MDLAYLERLIDLVGRSPVSELELARDGWRVRIVKAGAAVERREAPQPNAGAPTAEVAAPRPQEETHRVVAGLVGTFYRGPGPDQPPFMSVGDIVADGQTLGLIEAMKTFVPVEADRSGRIAAILCENGSTVATGDPLFAIEPV